MRPVSAALLAAVVLAGCSRVEPSVAVGPVGAPAQSAGEREARRVLLVINSASEDSKALGAYYRQKRAIPSENVVLVNVSETENVPFTEYEEGIQAPVRTAIKASKHRIDFIVLTKGVPIRLRDDGGYSVDGHLAAMDLALTAITAPKEEEVRRSLNPYFNRTEPFDSSKFKMYLVTRLDGYTLEDAKRLVDSSLAAKPAKGPFFFDQAGNRKSAGYQEFDSSLAKARSGLEAREFQAGLDATDQYVVPAEPLMGYASWGSNDSAWTRDAYRKLRFLPGAVCETFVSTSAFTFKKKDHWQSLIADLIEQGVTGVKGYVSEPYTFALARPEILFDRYTRGYNLAESFYMASLVTKWKDVVVGDPLCRPYPSAP